jgi:hypothetical protein
MPAMTQKYRCEKTREELGNVIKRIGAKGISPVLSYIFLPTNQLMHRPALYQDAGSGFSQPEPQLSRPDGYDLKIHKTSYLQ